MSTMFSILYQLRWCWNPIKLIAFLGFGYLFTTYVMLYLGTGKRGTISDKFKAKQLQTILKQRSDNFKVEQLPTSKHQLDNFEAEQLQRISMDRSDDVGQLSKTSKHQLDNFEAEQLQKTLKQQTDNFETSQLHKTSTQKPDNIKVSTDLPLFFTDYEAYQNYSGPWHIPGPMVDPDDFAVLIAEPDLCDERRHPKARILNYIHSAPGNLIQRNLIRKAWASESYYERLRIVTVFFMGRTRSLELQESIKNESMHYRDIIQVDYQDTYNNLTYKTVTALRWIERRCLHVEFILKMDDDIYANMFGFVRHLSQLNASADVVYCYEHHAENPIRGAGNKWSVSKEEYPWARYPDFCAGAVCFYRSHVVSRLLREVTKVPFLKLDDVYVTGLMRNKSGIPLQDASNFINIHSGHLCEKRRGQQDLFCHISDVQRRWDLWVNLLNKELIGPEKGNRTYVK